LEDHRAACGANPFRCDGNLNPREFWNINLSHPINASATPVYELCERDKKSHEFPFEKEGNQYSYSGIFHNRPRTKGFDVDVCLSGKIAVSRLKI
jgi:5'-nucleotidase